MANGEARPQAPFIGAVVYGLLYALILWAARSYALVDHGLIERPLQALVLSLPRIPGQWAFGTLLGALAVMVPLRLGIAFIPSVLFLAIEAVCIQHEAILGELPGADAFLYAGQLGQLDASVTNAWWLAAMTVGLGSLVLAAAAWRLRRLQKVDARLSKGALGLFVAMSVLALVTHNHPALYGPSYALAGRSPLIKLAAAGAHLTSDENEAPAPGSSRLRWLQRSLGHERPFAGEDPRYPLCRATAPTARRSPNQRSVIVVVLESVGLEEMFKEREGSAVMPALRRIAEESFSSNAFHASGTKSAQALPALFAGEPAQSAGLPVWREPLPSFDGYPRQLERAGYRTGYFHGGDLSFEQQRAFLQMVGFEEIDELDVLREGDPTGWGHPDSVMFDRFREWLDRMERGEAPYLGALSTLSSHHPYSLPPGEARVWRQRDQEVEFDETLAYLDRQLARFYTWYNEVARPQGTYLVLVGDHTPRLDLSRRIAAGEPVRFDVPFIVAGNDPELSDPRFRDRLAGQHDVPATLAGLTGIPTGRCDQGLDIFGDLWPTRRVVYGLAGRDLTHMYLRTPSALGRWSRETGQLEMLTQGAAGTPDAKYLLAVSETLLALSRHRLTANNFAPPDHEGAAQRASISGGRIQHILAHRGNIEGPGALGSGNRLSSFRAAVDAGFEWIEADLNVTRDEVVVVLHDRTVTDSMGQTLRVEDLSYDALRSLPGHEHVVSLDQLFESVGQSVSVCLDIKPPFTQDASRRLVRALARSLRRARQDGHLTRKVMADGFSLPLIASIAQSCECEVGWDLPNDEPITTGQLDTAAASGMDWIFIHHRQLDPSVVQQAHRRGLRVMVYTVNEPEELNGLLVEGIITDHKRLREQLEP